MTNSLSYGMVPEDYRTTTAEERIVLLPCIVYPTDLTEATRRRKSKKRVTFSPDVCMQLAITEGDEEEIRRLVAEYGERVLNEPEPNGLYPIMRAVIDEQLECLHVLVEAGADMTVRDEDGWTVLHAAAATNNAGAASYIVAKSEEDLTQARDTEGQRPIDVTESSQMSALLSNGGYHAGTCLKQPSASRHSCYSKDRMSIPAPSRTHF